MSRRSHLAAASAGYAVAWVTFRQLSVRLARDLQLPGEGWRNIEGRNLTADCPHPAA